MAIKINNLTKEYCQNCPEFECMMEVEREYKTDMTIHNVTIECKHRRKCRTIKRYLDEICMEEKSNNGLDD